MRRRTLLQWMSAATAILPFERVRLFAQPGELSPESIALLREIAPTVLPSDLGGARVAAIVDRFVAWTKGYREGVAMTHGYGHPRLQKTGASPVPRYNAQLAALERAARAKGARWPALDPQTRRALLDEVLTAAGVRSLPPRPMGQHVVVDLMAFYFRSSEANDDCYNALINREVCRPIEVTVRRPDAIR